MAVEKDPNRTKRAKAFAMWSEAPMPMVTLFKTLDVTNVVRTSRKTGCGFNLLMCFVVGKAAAAEAGKSLCNVVRSADAYGHII